jgi:hypothetical protein
VISNPFPGDAPYRAADRARFFGREEISRALAESILASPLLVVYGPRGAGKTSLLQAAVFPALVASQDARIVSIGAWPAAEDPLVTVVDAMQRDLRLSERSSIGPPIEPLLDVAKRAVRGSSRLTILGCDQAEEIIAVDRAPPEVDAIFASIEQLLALLLQPLRVVFCLREEHLGRFFDRLRGRTRSLDQYVRVAPLTVAEMTDVVCKAAALGDPPELWSPAEIQLQMMELRAPDQPAALRAEVRLADAQLLCRALFQERALTRPGPAEPAPITDEPEGVK